MSDVVKANLLAIEDKLSKSPVNVCTGVATSTLELAHALEQVAGVKASLTNGPRREGDVERSVLDPGSPPPLAQRCPVGRADAYGAGSSPATGRLIIWALGQERPLAGCSSIIIRHTLIAMNSIEQFMTQSAHAVATIRR